MMLSRPMLGRSGGVSWRLTKVAAIWLTFGAGVAVLSHWPVFAPVAADHGELKLSLAHLTERLEECRLLTPEEVAALPPNMRTAERCPRERAMAFLVLEADGHELLRQRVRPAGLHRDGRAYLYHSWHLPAADYELRFMLRDSARDTGFDQDQTLHLSLSPGASVLLHVGDGEAMLKGARDEPGG
jgi:hypothetical protein